MQKRLVTTLGVVLAALVATSTATSATSKSEPVPLPAPVVEFYNAGLDHYFMSADPGEVAVLDAGILSGWRRTGAQFTAFASLPTDSDLSPVCRFYGLPQSDVGDSHFFSGSPAECAEVSQRFADSWQLETSDAFQVLMPDASSGSCPPGYAAVYRLYNARADANHRYTTDAAIVQSMLAQGYVLEGSGSGKAVFCTPSTAAIAGMPSTSIVTMPIAEDTFQFSGIALPSTGASAVSYAWDYGDGETSDGATNWHRFDTAGVFPVALTVTDNKGAVSRATQTVTAVPHTAPPPQTAAAAASDFERRRSSPGVVRWFDFDTPAQLGSRAYGANFGATAGTAAAPVIDTSVAASGTGSLRFDIPSQSGPNAGGAWFANFSPDLSVQFGENSEFYVQWRQRFSKSIVDTYFNSRGGGSGPGIKQAIITTGDQPGHLYASCEAIGNVITTYYQRRFPIVYNSCTGSASHGPYTGLYENVGGRDGFLLENGLPPPSCPYGAMRGGGTSAPSNCFGWVADEWMTFQVGITLGPRDNTKAEFTESRLRLWVAREGEPSQLVVDWKPGVKGYFPLTAGPLAQNQRFGKVFLLPYMTGKDILQTHDLAQTWYDELIISTQRIPDPAPAARTTSNGYPAWRKGKAIGAFFEIPNTANLNGAVMPASLNGANVVDEWSGWAASTRKLWFAASTGHGTWQNPVIEIDLSADAPRWATLDPGSKSSDVDLGPYYADGRPTSRHTYWTSQFLSGKKFADGQDRVFLVTAYGTYATGLAGGYAGGRHVDAFRVADRKWDAAGTWADAPVGLPLTAVFSDPASNRMFVAAGTQTRGDANGLSVFDPAVNQWQPIGTTPAYPAPGRMLEWQAHAAVIDTKRNLAVCLHDGKPNDASGTIRLNRVDLATGAVTNVLLTGDLQGESISNYPAMVYDPDGDRYLVALASPGQSSKIYAIDADSGASRLIAAIGTPVTAAAVGRLSYLADLGGVAYLPRFASNVMFMPTR